MNRGILATSQSFDSKRSKPTTEIFQSPRKHRKVRRQPIAKYNFNIPGVSVIVLSEETQKLISCIVGEHVTSENTWTRIPKFSLEYDMDARDEISEFIPLRDEILKYPREELLLVYRQEEIDFDEFYICLTVEAEDTVTNLLVRQKEEQDRKAKNTIMKKTKPWKGYGSEKEIDFAKIRQNRTLIMVEAESEYPLSESCYKLRLRLAKVSMESFMDMLPQRSTFANLLKLQLTTSVQVSPSITPMNSQTIYTYPTSIATQYTYECEYITTLGEEVMLHFRAFIRQEMDALELQLRTNGHIDFYTNDYNTLVLDENTTQPGEKRSMQEALSIMNYNWSNGKGISCFSWHPMWVGTMAVAYSKHPACIPRVGPNTEDRVNNSTFDLTPVLLWSFVDILHPSLLLETPSEVTCLAFCPYDENLLAGGCFSGQVIIWDLTNKLEKAEDQKMLSADQQRYRNLMNSYMLWIKNTRNIRVIRQTVVSDIYFSHKAPVSSIEWTSMRQEFTAEGKLAEIPRSDNRISKQFVTCANDGNILVWDLNSKPQYTQGGYSPQKKLRRLNRRPSALTVDVSPFRILHRILRPIFQGTILVPGTSRPLPLSGMTLHRTFESYEEVHPDPNRKFNICERIKFKPVLTTPMKRRIYEVIASSAEGDYALASWSGYEVQTGETVTKETFKIKSFAKYHDGPIVSISRSYQHPDLILTVGGKVFAIWNTAYFGKPILWRRCIAKYTHGAWFILGPSRLRVARSDGYFEIWDFVVRSDAPMFVQKLSECALISAVTYPQNLEQNFFALNDIRGNCRIFYLSRSSVKRTSATQSGTYQFCVRERERKLKLANWHDTWCSLHPDVLNVKAERARIQQESVEEAYKSKLVRIFAEVREKNEEDTVAKPEPGKYTEWAKKRWLAKETKRVSQSLLKSRLVNVSVLEANREPLLKLQELEMKKKLKLQYHLEHIQSTQDIFILPVAEPVKKPPSLDPLILRGETMANRSILYDNYKTVVHTSTAYIQKHEFKWAFSYARILADGKFRRKLLDGYYSRYTHDSRFDRKQLQQNSSINDVGASRKYYVLASGVSSACIGSISTNSTHTSGSLTSYV